MKLIRKWLLCSESFSLTFPSNSLIHSVETNLREHGDKLDSTVKAEVQKAVDEAKALGQDASLDLLKEKSQALSNASMKIGQAMYGSGSANKAGGEESQNNGQPTEEAEFKEKK